MKSVVFIIILILSANQFAYAQYNKDKIEVEQSFGGNKYLINGQRIRLKQMTSLMQDDESAYTLIKSGKAYSTSATILGATGGLLIGLNVGAAIASGRNGSVKWGMAIAGGVLVLISVPISITGTKRTLEAVDIYNANITSESFHQIRTEFRIGFTGSGIGLIIKL